ncbi:helix-turn-helix domain-containing protein [Streptomyces sp. NBC_00872]|uniref:helix-turn-helix domain-containing protein n=1 Tax=Streptomyces sp. NBC_00872 TaxID=2903686 RepID=UPI00386CCBFF|nr:XRE family transcriptional regulator [Streptomyces sp. NBC_00872]
MSGADAVSRAAEGERLAAELSALRERTGLSLAALAERTPYSKSSWQRYLNGTQPLPRQAVEALCALADEPSVRLLALWELADVAWSGRAETAGATRGAATAGGAGTTGGASVTAVADTAGGAGTADTSAGAADRTGTADRAGAARTPSGGASRKRGRALTLALVATAVAIVAVAHTAVLDGAGLLRDGDADGDGRRRNAADATWIQASPLVPGCTESACDGKNPTLMDCGGQGMVTTVDTFTATGGQRLELRYGEYCRAVWVRTSRLRLGDRVVLTVSGGKAAQLVAIQRDVGRYVSTPMAGSSDPADARVCLTPGGGDRRGSEECFGFGPSASP